MGLGQDKWHGRRGERAKRREGEQVSKCLLRLYLHTRIIKIKLLGFHPGRKEKTYYYYI